MIPSISNTPIHSPPVTLISQQPAPRIVDNTTTLQSMQPEHGCVAYIKNFFKKIREFFSRCFNCFPTQVMQDPLPPPPIPILPSPTPPTENPFAALALTDPEKHKIHTLIQTMGGSWFTLIRERSRLEQIGREIEHVHPLKFLEYIFTQPSLPSCVESISNSSLTWGPFVNGISEKLSRDARLDSLVVGFARALGINKNDIEPYFRQKQWEMLVRFLMDVKLGRKQSVWAEEVPPPITPSSLSFGDLPFDDNDASLLYDLVTTYAQSYQFMLQFSWVVNDLEVKCQPLFQRNPLKILTRLHAQPLLLNDLKSILNSRWGRREIFLQTITFYFSNHPFEEMQPYIQEFAQTCHGNPERISNWLQCKEWDKLLTYLTER